MTHIDEVNLEVKVLRAELKNVIQDIREIKQSQKEQERFMYEFKGGKKWLFSILTLSAALGGAVTHIFSIFSLKG